MNTASEKVHSDKVSLDDSELPPSYGESSTAIPSSRTHAPGFPPPTNYLYRSRTGVNSLCGAFAIDPSMEIPSSILPPLPQGEGESDRKNLSFSAEDGNIVANVILLSSSPLSGRRRTYLAFATKGGAINVHLRAAENAAPYLLDITSQNGEVNIRLPRSFHGLIRLGSSTGSVSLSTPLSDVSTPLSELNGADTWFVGNLSSFSGETWTGCEVIVRVKHSNVKVRYDDSDEIPAVPDNDPPSQGGKGEPKVGFWYRFRRR